jgi:hypothetical protein
MIMLFANLRQRNRVFIMAAAALRHQRKSGEMSASGRQQKRTGARHKCPLYPMFIFCMILEHMEKAKARTKGGRPGLALVVVFESSFALSLACQKKSAPPLF